MKNKKFLATLLATSMLMGSSLTVFADDVAITGNTTQEVPMSMTVTAEDLEAAGSLTDVTVRIPARMTLAYKNGSYISTDKVGAFGTLPSYKKVIISNEDSDIEFKNTDESKTVTGKLTLGMLNEDLIVSSEELAAGKADANDIKYSQVTAKVNTKNLENADTFSGTANLKVKIEALRDTTGLTVGNIGIYSTTKDNFTIWNTKDANLISLISNGSKFSQSLMCSSGLPITIANFKNYVNDASESDLPYMYKPNVKILNIDGKQGSTTPLKIEGLFVDTNMNKSTIQSYLNSGLYPENMEEIFFSPFMCTPNLELLIFNHSFNISNTINSYNNSNDTIFYVTNMLNGIYFVKDYDADNNLFVYIPNISFNGTMEEWNAKAEWKFPKMANTVTVYCTDGTITYE